jgi:hypothetical protein
MMPPASGGTVAAGKAQVKLDSDVIDAGEREGRHGNERHDIHVEDRRDPERSRLTVTQHDTLQSADLRI